MNLDNLMQELTRFGDRLRALELENRELRAENERLRDTVDQQRTENFDLKWEMAGLRVRARTASEAATELQAMNERARAV